MGSQYSFNNDKILFVLKNRTSNIYPSSCLHKLLSGPLPNLLHCKDNFVFSRLPVWGGHYVNRTYTESTLISD